MANLINFLKHSIPCINVLYSHCLLISSNPLLVLADINLNEFCLCSVFICLICLDEVYSLGVAASPLAPGGAIAYYESGTADGSRPGKFYVKLDPLSAQTRYEATTLTLHEGNPGHNFQFAFNKNQKKIPQFITNPMFSRYSLSVFFSYLFCFFFF